MSVGASCQAGADSFQDQFPEYDIFPDGETERILPAGITERFARGADGALVPITRESTKAVAKTRLHAGIVKAKRYAFEMP